MYTCKFHISQDFICLIVIVYIVFGFKQTQRHALINYSNYSSVVACQRYLCSYVIPMTMEAFIFKNLSLKTVLLNNMSK